MASAKIEDRTLFPGGPWDVIKKKNPVLAKGLFTPSMDPLVNKYEKDQESYGKLKLKRQQLWQIIAKVKDKSSPLTASLIKLAEELNNEVKEISSQTAEHSKKLTDCGENDHPDTKGAYSALTALSDDCTQNAASYKVIGDKMSTILTDFAALLKKAGAEYKSAADALDSEEKKLEVDLNGLDDQIRKLAKTYQAIAIKADKGELADDVIGFLKYLG